MKVIYCPLDDCGLFKAKTEAGLIKRIYSHMNHKHKEELHEWVTVSYAPSRKLIDFLEEDMGEVLK